MGKGSSWNLQEVKATAVDIGRKLLDQTKPQEPANMITNAQARWLVTWIEVLINEWPKKTDCDTVKKALRDAISCFGKQSDILVTEERKEAWQHALDS